MTTYLENYLASVNTLPTELRRNFELMRQLDEKTQEDTSKVESVLGQYRSSNKRPINELLTDQKIEELRQNLQDCIERGEEKIKIAGQTYEVVDKHIRRLDQDLKKFELELERERLQQEQQQKQVLKAKGKQKTAQRRGSRRVSTVNGANTNGSAVEETDPRKLKRPRTSDSLPLMPSQPEGTLYIPLEPQVAGFDIPEMPIDPNEPVYCTCRRVSFGQMIGCDNENCPIEWFHFECVGLTEPVKGKWYCHQCRERKT